MSTALERPRFLLSCLAEWHSDAPVDMRLMILRGKQRPKAADLFLMKFGELHVLPQAPRPECGPQVLIHGKAPQDSDKLLGVVRVQILKRIPEDLLDNHLPRSDCRQLARHELEEDVRQRVRLHSYAHSQVTGSLQTLIFISWEEPHVLYVRRRLHRLEPFLELLLGAADEEREAFHLPCCGALRLHHLKRVAAVGCDRYDRRLRVLAPQRFVPRVRSPRY